MKQKEKEIESTLYVPPEVVAVEVQVERGFAGSNEGTTSDWTPKEGQWE